MSRVKVNVKAADAIASIEGVERDVYSVLLNSSRGPTTRGLVVQGFEGIRSRFGRVVGSDVTMLSAFVASETGVKRFAVSRVVGTGARYGSARFLDLRRNSTLLGLMRFIGAGGDVVALSTVRPGAQSTTVATPGTTPAATYAEATWTFGSKSDLVNAGDHAACATGNLTPPSNGAAGVTTGGVDGVVVDDGINPALTYHWDADGSYTNPPTNHRRVVLSGGDTRLDVATKTRNAIQSDIDANRLKIKAILNDQQGRIEFTHFYAGAAINGTTIAKPAGTQGSYSVNGWTGGTNGRTVEFGGGGAIVFAESSTLYGVDNVSAINIAEATTAADVRASTALFFANMQDPPFVLYNGDGPAVTALLRATEAGSGGNITVTKNLQATSFLLPSLTGGNTYAAGAITAATRRFGVNDVTQFQVGDSCEVTKAGNTAVLTIQAIDAGNSEIVCTEPLLLGGATYVGVGAAIATSSTHLVQTTLADAVGPGSVSATLRSASGARKGQVLVIQHPSDLSVKPLEVKLTQAPNGTSVSFEAVGGSDTFPAGSKVSSVEFYLKAQEPGMPAEEYEDLSLSNTCDGLYVGDKLGKGVSLEIGATALPGVTLATAALESGATQSTLSSTTGVEKGNFYAFKTAQDDVVLFHAKSVDSVAKTVAYDNVGVLPASIATSTPLYPVTLTVNDDPHNTSDFLILQEVNVAGVGNSLTPSTEERYRIPRPVSGVLLTGGMAGAMPTGAQVIGSKIGGVRTGLYALEVLPEFKQIAAVIAPGFDQDDPEDRAALETAAEAWCDARFLQFLGGATSNIVRPMDIKPYREETLGADTWHGSLAAPWAEIQHPDNPDVRVELPPDGWVLGAYAKMQRAGAHVPPGMVELPLIRRLTVEMDDDEAEVIAKSGVNLIRKLSGAYYLTTSRTLYRNAKDGTKRDHANVACWLDYCCRSLEIGLQGLLEKLGNEHFFDAMRAPIVKFLRAEKDKGVFSQQAEEDCFYVEVNDILNPDEQKAYGKYKGRVGVSPAGAVREIELEILVYQGSVRVQAK